MPLDELLLKARGLPRPRPDRHDFPLALEPKLLLRTQAGVAYAAGLVRADLRAASIAAGTPVTGTVSVRSNVRPPAPPRLKGQRAFAATAAADGSLVASYGLP